MSKKRRFTVPFKKQHGNRAQTLSKSERRLIYHNFWSLRRQLSLQKSFLGICKILRLFGNTFTADDKYSLLSGANLRQPIQMQLSQTQNVFSHFFSIVLKFRLNFEYLKKNDTIANVFSKLRTPKNVCRYISKKRRFTVRFNK